MRDTLASLHPDCPDWQRLGPTPTDAVLRAQAAAVTADTEERDEQWSRGFTRRRLLAGGLGVGVAAMTTQLVTTRVSWAAPGADAGGTLIVVFLRGGMDGLSVLVPADDPELLKARPSIAVRAASLLNLQRGFGMHPSLAPLLPLMTAGRLAAVPAVSTPDLTRSHFQAQDCLERGGAARSSVQSGWLDRVLQELGAGTTFRGLGIGARMSRSLLGDSNPIMLSSLKDFSVKGIDGVAPQTMAALKTLYTGIDHPLGVQGLDALQASAQAQGYAKQQEKPAKERGYPDGEFGAALATLAQLIKAKAGVRVATVDLGGWDMHTDLGTVDGGDMTNSLKTVAGALAAFAAELGPDLDNTTVVTMSEFGRRVGQNANSGTDHGHGGVALVLGGGVKGGVHGRWEGLAPGVLDQGDVPGTNDYRDVLSEIVMRRLGLSEAQAGKVFPGWKPSSLGIMA
ncbi:DUF1501 domain-containing protein [Streptomyces sp. SID13031]|uniref:DUF1501 domain-containing protein n=1 Tax=Streptomyces sp. SID13031 TaxID=2706046 RepID=UPI0013CD79C6|nr:DUF1501 domain-containing protein [Streptomyces sp. SID13031]NEA34035.1 DUF1501 domain-containing protein [Streptomyces sp. SID13031]